MTTPQVIHDEPILKVIAWDLILCSRWHGAPTAEALRTFRELQRRHLEGLGALPAFMISCIDGRGSVKISTEARKEAEHAANEGKSQVIGLAQVVEGDGFGAATIRAVLSGLQLVTRPPYPVKVFSGFNEARPWVEDRLLIVERSDLAKSVNDQLSPLLKPKEA